MALALATPKAELKSGKESEADVVEKVETTEVTPKQEVLRSQLHMQQEIDREKNIQLPQTVSPTRTSLDGPENSSNLLETPIGQTAHDSHFTAQVREKPSQELPVTKKEQVEETAKTVQEAEVSAVHYPEASDKGIEYAQTKYENKDDGAGLLLLPVDERASRIELSEATERNLFPVFDAEHGAVQMAEEVQEKAERKPDTEEIEQEPTELENAIEYIALVELAEEYEDVEPLTIESLIPAYDMLDNVKDESPADHVAFGREASEEQESTTTEPMLIEQIADYVERNEVIEKEQQEKALAFIEEIKTISQQIIELKISESIEHLEHVEVHLEEACAELFEAISIEYDEEVMKQFVQTIMKQEIAKKLSVVQAGVELDDQGTHERKHFKLQDIMRGFKQEGETLHLLLGKCAVAVSAA